MKTRDALLAAECWAGSQISQQIRNHHHRRLRRLGWSSAFDPPPGGWAKGDLPVRSGNAIDVLVDGVNALPAIAAAIRGAESHVHITGWHFTPHFDLRRDHERAVLEELLDEVAERVPVRVLMWAGAPLPLFRPSRGDAREVRDRLRAGSRVQCLLDAKERLMHCHHEKTVVVDDKIAFVGGIDLTSESGDRYDTNEHVARGSVGWHDACVRIEGPAVADVAEHFRTRWSEVGGEVLPPVAQQQPAGAVDLQIVRTIPERVYASVERGVFTILESYLRALRGARRLVYLENQFLWSPEIAAVLADLLATHPDPDFRLVVLLPSKPNDGADDTRGVLGELIEADDHAGRFLACTLYARAGSRFDPVYVHAKIGIVDDEWLTLGSANLNEHSLFNDTEMNVVTHDAALAERVRRQLWSEHLELPEESIPDDPTQAVDALWKPISQEQLDLRLAGEPLTHRLVRLPSVSRRSARALGPFSSLLVDG